jgi:hypothetical protein
MRFRNCVIDKEIGLAIKECELLLVENSNIMNELKVKEDFKFDSGLGHQIVLNLLSQRPPVSVFVYKAKNPWSAALGYSDGKSIYINTRKLPINRRDLVGLLLHEYSHFCGYSHGNNWPSEEKNIYSVPYFISSNISRWI